MTYTEYVNFFIYNIMLDCKLFQTCSQNLAEQPQAPLDNCFARWVPSNDPFYPDKGLEEFIRQMKSGKMKFPFLLLQAPVSKWKYEGGNFSKKRMAAFIILDKADRPEQTNSKADMLQYRVNNAEIVGDSIIGFMTAYSIKNPTEFYFDPNTVEMEIVQPTDDIIGMRYNFVMEHLSISEEFYNPNIWVGALYPDDAL